MGIFTNWFKKKEPEQETRGLFCDSLMYNMNGGYTTNKAMLLSTVYRCVDVISDAVAQLPSVLKFVFSDAVTGICIVAIIANLLFPMKDAADIAKAKEAMMG